MCDVHTKAPEIDVPNVVGKTQAEAKKILEDAGFKVNISRNEIATEKKGVVLKQSTTKAVKGATITITVNDYDGGTSSSGGSSGGNSNTTNATTGGGKPTNSTGNGNTSAEDNTKKNETT